MKKITELLETFFTIANQRIKSPFLGSFIFSWILINWKPIFNFPMSKSMLKLRTFKILRNLSKIHSNILY